VEGGRVSSSKLKRSIQSTLMPRGIDPLFFSVPPQPHSTDSRSQSQTLKRRVHDDKKRQSTLFTRSVRRFPPPGHLPTHVYPGAPYSANYPRPDILSATRKQGDRGHLLYYPAGGRLKLRYAVGLHLEGILMEDFPLPSAPMIKHVWEKQGSSWRVAQRTRLRCLSSSRERYHQIINTDHQPSSLITRSRLVQLEE
jgi:hypothetical protein